jgi:hypothetical protein
LFANVVYSYAIFRSFLGFWLVKKRT